MKLDELQTRLTHLLMALSNEDSRIIQGFTKAFLSKILLQIKPG